MVAEGYLVAQTVLTISLLPPVDPNAPDKADLKIIQAEKLSQLQRGDRSQKRPLRRGS